MHEALATSKIGKRDLLQVVEDVPGNKYLCMC